MFEHLLAEICGAEAAGHADEVLAGRRGAFLLRGGLPETFGGKAYRKAVARGHEVEGEMGVALLLRSHEHSAPELPDLLEVELGGDAESDAQRAGTGHGGVELACHRHHALVAEVLEREVDEAEVGAFEQQTGGSDGGAVPPRR